MIGSHPGGLSLTKRLFAMSGMTPPGRVLDLGAGGGESVRYLRKCGYEAEGVDLSCGAYGDMRNLSFPDGSFHICLAECSISIC